MHSSADYRRYDIHLHCAYLNCPLTLSISLTCTDDDRASNYQSLQIIMPDTLIGKKGTDGKLYECIKEKFQGMTIAAISRQHFSDANGLDRIKTLCAPEYSSVEIYIRQKLIMRET